MLCGQLFKNFRAHNKFRNNQKAMGPQQEAASKDSAIEIQWVGLAVGRAFDSQQIRIFLGESRLTETFCFHKEMNKIIVKITLALDFFFFL